MDMKGVETDNYTVESILQSALANCNIKTSFPKMEIVELIIYFVFLKTIEIISIPWSIK